MDLRLRVLTGRQKGFYRYQILWTTWSWTVGRILIGELSRQDHSKITLNLVLFIILASMLVLFTTFIKLNVCFACDFNYFSLFLYKFLGLWEKLNLHLVLILLIILTNILALQLFLCKFIVIGLLARRCFSGLIANRIHFHWFYCWVNLTKAHINNLLS